MIALGSVFAGLGGLEGGLETGLAAAGLPARTAWQVEWAPYPTEILEREWPHALRFHDVHDVGVHNLPLVSIVCGGWPCTDASLAAGRWGRLGSEGERSGLWRELVRVGQELQPDMIVGENVGGALGCHRDRQRRPMLVDVLEALDVTGYDAFWTVLSAYDVGAPHRRDRVFVVAWRRTGSPRAVSAISSSSRAGFADWPDLSATAWPAGPCEKPRRGEPARSLRWAKEMPYHMERIAALGNCVVPQCAYAIGHVAAALHARRFGGLLRVMNPPRLWRAGERTPQGQAVRLSRLALAMLAGEVPLRSHTMIRDEHRVAPWPSLGLMVGGEALVPLDLRGRRAAPACFVGSGCGGADVEEAPGLWPTMTKRDYKSGKAGEGTHARNQRPLSEVAAPQGFLNPAWVELLAGFPEGYTRLERPRTPPRPRSLGPV